MESGKTDEFKPRTLEAAVRCQQCNATFPPPGRNFATYFVHDVELCCPACTKPMDWWAIVVDALTDGFLGYQFAPIRAQSTVAEAEMKSGSQLTLDLQRLGVPRTARILYVNYTPGPSVPKDADGMFWPLEIHSNTPHRQILPDCPLMLFPMPAGNTLPDKQALSILIVWVDQAGMGIPEAALLTAVEAFHEERYPEAVVSATTAIEASLDGVLLDFFKRFADLNSTRELLRRSGLAGKSDVLLPMLCGTIDAPSLPPLPRKALGELRRLRNRAAHTGHLPDDTSRERIAEAVAGAIFAVEHAQLLDRLLDQAVADRY